MRLKAAMASLDSKLMGCDQALQEKVDAVGAAGHGRDGEDNLSLQCDIYICVYVYLYYVIYILYYIIHIL